VPGMGLGVLVSAPWLFSSIYGYEATAKCRAVPPR
jgi:hypothetical protein